jgi:hypothetical protein
MAVCLAAILPLIRSGAAFSAELKPYRVLVVIGDQWRDPGSYNIDENRVSGGDFRDMISMLKIWGVPFDILRLDQQRLQINRFLDGTAKPNYSCIIWMADPNVLKGQSANYETLRRAVEDFGMSLIVLFDYVKTPEVAGLVSADYQGQDVAKTIVGKEGFSITKGHFITEGATGVTLPGKETEEIGAIRCKPRQGTVVLGTLRGAPQFLVRDIREDTKAVWIGGGRSWLRKYPVLRKVFRQALVHCIGYGVFNDNFENALIFTMSDIGASEHAYSLNWHYPTPTKEVLEKYLIEPLEKNGFMMVQNITPGYANPKTRMVELPWTIARFTDPFGNVQDYPSTMEGLMEGLQKGVFELQAHRAWNHLNWDLDSPPGPYWDGPVTGEMANSGWYQETYDRRRNQPVPANDMLFTYKVGRDAIEKPFGVTPLAATVQVGKDMPTDTGRLAALAGYGVGREHYLGCDYVIQFSMMIPEEVGCHDLDLAAESEKVAGKRRIDLRGSRWWEPWKDKHWIGYNEYCAYIHSKINVSQADLLTFVFDYDAHYCQQFGKKPSSWTLELSDRVLKQFRKEVRVSVDGEAAKQALKTKMTISLPPGTGVRKVQIANQ